MKYLSAILRYFNEKDYKNRENVAIVISDFFEENSRISEEEFLKKIKSIKSDFFRLNEIDKVVFTKAVYERLRKVDKQQKNKESNFDLAKRFIAENLEVSYSKEEHKEERKKLLDEFKNIPKPHPKLVESLDSILNKINQSSQMGLHGVKEYSGVDIVKKIDSILIGFQIKTINDDITEDKIRAQTSKADEYNLDGFVWIYGRPPSKDVDNSVQAVFHYYVRINEKRKIYCTIILPEQFAELLRKHSIDLSSIQTDQ